MKTKGKAWQLVVTVLLIAAFVYTAFFGVAVKYGDVTRTYIKGAQDIRFGVDIKGGVNVTFAPSDGYDATDEQLDAAQLVIENRLVGLNVTDYELYVDYDSDRLILEFPWQSGETDFDPEAAIEEIGTTAYLTFREAMPPPGSTRAAAPSASGWMTRMSARPRSMRPLPTALPSSQARHPTPSRRTMSSRWPARSTPARCPLR